MEYKCRYCGKICKNKQGLSQHENRCIKNKDRLYDLETDIFICKYCGKICKNKNALSQHEIRCNENPQKIQIYSHGHNLGSSTKGYKFIHKNKDYILVKPDDLQKYLDDGWFLGMSEEHKQKYKNCHTSKSTGRCKDELNELKRREKISNAMKGNTNWMNNKRHGNSKQGWYNGIHFDSTWELAFYIYYKEHNMYIERNKNIFRYTFENSVHKYIPDFITDEGIIEVKGRKDKKALAKENQFPDIIIFDATKMKPILQYMIDKYGNDFYLKIYEN